MGVSERACTEQSERACTEQSERACTEQSERACTEQSERGAARIPYPMRVQQPNSEVGVAGIPYPDGDALTFGLKGRSEKKPSLSSVLLFWPNPLDECIG
jgi:hypothetical protein